MTQHLLTSFLCLSNLVLVILVAVTVTAGSSTISSSSAVRSSCTVLLGKAALQLSCFLQALLLLLYLLIPEHNRRTV